MMKRMLGVVVAFAMVFGVAGMAFAEKDGCHYGRCGDNDRKVMPMTEISVENEHTYVNTSSSAFALTGGVVALGHHVKVTTGDASKVYSSALSQVNMTEFPTCALCGERGMKVDVENEHTWVNTRSRASAVTGVVGAVGCDATVKTGEVMTVQSGATSVVNYTNFGFVQPVSD